MQMRPDFLLVLIVFFPFSGIEKGLKATYERTMSIPVLKGRGKWQHPDFRIYAIQGHNSKQTLDHCREIYDPANQKARVILKITSRVDLWQHPDWLKDPFPCTPQYY